MNFISSSIKKQVGYDIINLCVKNHVKKISIPSILIGSEVWCLTPNCFKKDFSSRDSLNSDVFISLRLISFPTIFYSLIWWYTDLDTHYKNPFS